MHGEGARMLLLLSVFVWAHSWTKLLLIRIFVDWNREADGTVRPFVTRSTSPSLSLDRTSLPTSTSVSA